MATSDTGSGSTHSALHLPDVLSSVPEPDQDRDVIVGVSDSRLAVVCLTAPGSDEYIAVMDVLEASVGPDGTDAVKRILGGLCDSGGITRHRPRRGAA